MRDGDNGPVHSHGLLLSGPTPKIKLMNDNKLELCVETPLIRQLFHQKICLGEFPVPMEDDQNGSSSFDQIARP